MTTVSLQDVRQLASLSALTLSDDELESLRVDISNILSYIEQLGELDTTGVEPTYQVTGLTNVFRDDVVAEHDAKPETIVRLAQEHQENQFKVPKVL